MVVKHHLPNYRLFNHRKVNIKDWPRYRGRCVKIVYTKNISYKYKVVINNLIYITETQYKLQFRYPVHLRIFVCLF